MTFFDGRMGRGATSPPRAQSLGSAVARRANSGRDSREASLTRSGPDRLVIAMTTARLESIREGACGSEERVAEMTTSVCAMDDELVDRLRRTRVNQGAAAMIVSR
jgi:hypothetical protein